MHFRRPCARIKWCDIKLFPKQQSVSGWLVFWLLFSPSVILYGWPGWKHQPTKEKKLFVVARQQFWRSIYFPTRCSFAISSGHFEEWKDFSECRKEEVEEEEEGSGISVLISKYIAFDTSSGRFPRLPFLSTKWLNVGGGGGGGGGFFLACEDFGDNVQLFIPCLHFFFFFLEVEISSCTLIPLIMPDQSTVA